MSKIKNDGLADLVELGGVYRGVPGGYPGEIFANIVGILTNIPSQKTQALLQAIIEREALVSTGIGNGIALPHPRTPLLEEGEKPFVAIIFPVRPLDWNTPDGSKVHTIFLIISESAKQHLGVLSKINFICRQKKFYSLLEAQASKEEIIAAIREAETAWAQV